MSHKIEISVTDTAIVETLVTVLDQHFNELPVPVQEAVRAIAECDVFEIDSEYLMCKGMDPREVKCIINGELATHVVSVNKILKRVTIGSMGDSYPKQLSLTCGDTVVCSWGDV